MPSRNPSSETAPYTGSTTITSGHLPSASSMLRAQLSIHGAKLSPIPGSPAIELSIEDIPPLYETAGVVARQDLHRSSTSDLQAVRAHQRGTSLPIPSKGANAGTSDSLQRSKASTYQWSGPFGTGQSSAALGAFTPTRARGVSQGLQVRSQPLQGSFTSPEAIRTLPPSLAGLSASQPSKADVSEDWRQKSQQEIPAVEIQRPTAPASPQQDTENSPPDVMTIDSLFAKFQKVSPLDAVRSC